VCTGGACANLALGNGGVGGTLTGSNPPKVAVVADTSGSTDLTTRITAVSSGVFSSVATVNFAFATPPSLATLKTYDAILVYIYNTATPTSFGDDLATYFEAGGGVVLATYLTQATTTNLNGRFETQYTLSTQVSSSSFLTTAATLGTPAEPTSPLLNGVVTFGYQGSTPYHLPGSAFTKNSPIIVAPYSDGSPAVVRGVVGSGTAAGRNLVEINGSGSSTTWSSSYGWNTATDGAKLFRNALLFSLPAQAISVAKQLALGTQPLYTQTAPQAVTYTNGSSSPQTITALALSGNNIGDFAAVPSAGLPVTIAPGGTFVVNVTFAPSGLGLRGATLAATVQGYGTPATTLLPGTGN
jgi:hypothetical protein